MIAIYNQSISVVEDPGFINFVKSLEPRYKILSRKYFTEKVFPKMIIFIGLRLSLTKFCLLQMSSITALPQIYGALMLLTDAY